MDFARLLSSVKSAGCYAFNRNLLHNALDLAVERVHNLAVHKRCRIHIVGILRGLETSSDNLERLLVLGVLAQQFPRLFILYPVEVYRIVTLLNICAIYSAFGFYVVIEQLAYQVEVSLIVRVALDLVLGEVNILQPAGEVEEHEFGCVAELHIALLRLACKRRHHRVDKFQRNSLLASVLVEVEVVAVRVVRLNIRVEYVHYVRTECNITAQYGFFYVCVQPALLELVEETAEHGLHISDTKPFSPARKHTLLLHNITAVADYRGKFEHIIRTVWVDTSDIRIYARLVVHLEEPLVWELAEKYTARPLYIVYAFLEIIVQGIVERGYLLLVIALEELQFLTAAHKAQYTAILLLVHHDIVVHQSVNELDAVLFQCFLKCYHRSKNISSKYVSRYARQPPSPPTRQYHAGVSCWNSL